MIALDTFLPAIYQYLVEPGKMSWQTVARACSDAPRRLMGLAPVSLEEGAPANLVVFDPEAGSCRIFEIKHSEEAASQQYRHLIDEQKCAQTEHRYGPITGKFVLYRGESQVIDGIQYQNVEEYLRSLA